MYGRLSYINNTWSAFIKALTDHNQDLQILSEMPASHVCLQATVMANQNAAMRSHDKMAALVAWQLQ